ncbi:ABC transporter permease [Ekhidna sp.]|uniref:ABC transporter permease n=1 Tax=Ekhidna sp. TaxID=2608089 RepID=UPI00329A6326
MSPKRPPRLFVNFFKWYCKPSLQETILGDMEEQFDEDLEQYGASKAKRRFGWTVLRFFRKDIIRSLFNGQKLNYLGMFKHNLLITYRGFKRHKSTFLINLIGLSTGLACVLFIYLWVTDEIRKDKFHEDNSHIYQVYSNHHDASGTFTWKGVPGLLADEIKAKVSEVKHVVAATDAHEYTLSTDNDAYKVNGKFANEYFFDVFSFPITHGDAKNALVDPSSIVITESLAERLFSTSDAVGKTLEFHFWQFKKTLTVTAVIEDLTTATSDQFDFIMSWTYYHEVLVSYKQWGNYYARVIVELNDPSNKKQAEQKIDAIFKENLEGTRTDLFLTNYSDQYLFNKYENGEQTGGRIEYVKLFSAVALFILIIACINFINLSTAKASQKTKEIGVKKSLGASRNSLVAQYFTETTCLSLLGLFVAYALVYLLLPQFNYLSEKELSLNIDGNMIFSSLVIILIVGIIAGSYPSFYLSGMNILKSLKPSLSIASRHSWGRRALVIVQFSISIVLIVATILIQQQMRYVQTKNLGYDRDNIVYFEREGKLLENHDAFISELQDLSGVEKTAASGFMVGGGNSTGGVSWEGKTEEEQVQFWETKAGYGLIDLLGIELVEGRAFDPSFGTDSTSIIFNETAIAAMGMEDPIGKTIHHYSGDKKIIGVVKDFNLISLHTKVEPALFLFNPEQTHFIMVKIESGKELETIEKMESLYDEFNTNYPFNPRFVDQDYQALYSSEERVASLSGYFAGLAIMISCLGLFGLASFTTERRTKEIGIRKVMGSGVWNIVLLLTKDFTKMVGIAIVIGIPLSYYLGAKWLENYAYSIALEWWLFIGAGIIALLIAWITVGTQTIKAATVNPVESLKDE